MISDTPKGSKSNTNSKGVRPLKRGKACMSCRFLKIKCDGEKPICGPCKTHPRDDECEYADGPGRSRTKVLEDTVSRLEARLLELENPESTTPSVILHHPYHQYSIQDHQYNIQVKSPPPLGIENPALLAPLSPFSPTSTTSSLPSGMPQKLSLPKEQYTELSGSSGSSTSPVRFPIAMPYLGAEEPTTGVLQASLDQFLPHAQQFGFFMHIPTFRRSALLAYPLGHESRPTPGLLSAVHLMGFHLSQPESFPTLELQLLTRAVQNVAVDLFGQHPNRIMSTLQAEILLAYYFLRTGLLLEAKCRVGTAVAIALGAGLHKLRSLNITVPSTVGLRNDQPYTLPPPQDTVQEAERINGFWTVLALHKFITVALEPPAHVCGALEAPGMQIDTPWPVDLDRDSLDEVLRPELRGNSTVRAFLNGHHGYPGDNDSSITLVMKAAILFHRAAHLTGQYTPTMPPRDQSAYDAAAKAVNTLIESFRATLAPIPTYNTHHPNIRNVLLTHALVDAASIKLHSIFAYSYPASKQICLTSARNMVNYGNLNLQEIGHMNPIMGNLWMTACQIFVDEISRTRLMKSQWAGAAALEDDLMESYRNGLKVLSLFSQDSPLMRYQLTKVQEQFEAI